MHRGADGEPIACVEILAHPDLLPVEEDRSTRQGEQQAVDHPDASRITAEHRGQPTYQAAAEDLHALLRPKCREYLRPLLVGEFVEGQLVVVADERRPLDLPRWRRPLGQRFDQRPCVVPGQGQIEVLHTDEVELEGELVAVRTPPK